MRAIVSRVKPFDLLRIRSWIYKNQAATRTSDQLEFTVNLMKPVPPL
jgi:hypothetical protein